MGAAKAGNNSIDNNLILKGDIAMKKLKIWFQNNKTIALAAVVLGLAWIFLYSVTIMAFDVDELPYHNQVIRLHILSYDDSPAEQELKLAIRDGVWELVSNIIADADSIAEARVIIADSLPAIEEIARKIVAENNSYHHIRVQMLDDLSFPATSYGGIVFPRGRYTALQISIGEAAGANWWCVMFPPLCLMEISFAKVLEECDEEPERLAVRPRFAIADMWQRLRNLN